ncbi:MAG: hypothetical protein LCH63_16485 [Candidatus Melainabacteria bacterium]|nr:hypothetical protein [Candidatus Melainabacteria bacterium]
MSLSRIKEAVANKKMICQKCKRPVQKFEKYAETIDAVRDGFNIQEIESHATRVTLICNNDGCDWKERTEYWDNYIVD